MFLVDTNINYYAIKAPKLQTGQKTEDKWTEHIAAGSERFIDWEIFLCYRNTVKTHKLQPSLRGIA